MKNMMKSKKVTKGGPSGLVISLMIHAGAFLLAGMLVVFNVVKKEEKKFVPPKPVERPKMKLKKPKVKVKKNSKPKSSNRIVTKVKRADMPDIQLPEMSGMGEGFGGGGFEGFDLTPDLSAVTVFGGGQSIGNDFEGTFYDLKRYRNGNVSSVDRDTIISVLAKFVKSGWKTSELAKYYQSPRKLYATSFLVPTVPSSMAPTAFGEPETGGWLWVVHYKGKLVYTEDVKIRFWGFADDILVIRVNGKVVLNGSWPGESETIASFWRTSSADSYKYYLGNNLSVVGDWIELKAQEPLDMEILIGEVPGGQFSAMITVQVDGVEYENSRQNGPLLPMFKTAEPSRSLQDAILKDLVPGEASITNGPVFRDYGTGAESVPVEDELVEGVPDEVIAPETTIRIWTSTSGKTYEGEYVSTMGDKVIIKTPRGKQERILRSALSAEDQEFIVLDNPPEFSLDFIKSSSQRVLETSPYIDEISPRILDYTFGAKVKQKGAGTYEHELTLEYFAFAKDLLGESYVLVDRQTSAFSPSRENNFSHKYKGNRVVEVMEYVSGDARRGIAYAGNLVTLTDKRGKIIAYSASKSWLWEYYNNLLKLPMGSYLDRECKRVFPTSPKSFKW